MNALPWNLDAVPVSVPVSIPGLNFLSKGHHSKSKADALPALVQSPTVLILSINIQ